MSYVELTVLIGSKTTIHRSAWNRGSFPWMNLNNSVLNNDRRIVIFYAMLLYVETKSPNQQETETTESGNDGLAVKEISLLKQ